MMKFLRSQSQTVLVVVLAVIAIGFLFYGNTGNLLTTGGGRVSNDFGRIDGEDLAVTDLYDAVRTTRNSILISGGQQQLSQPGASAQVAELAWRQMLLLHEADRLHITVTDEQVADSIKKQPVFQKNGVFDLDTYRAQMKVLQNLLRVSPEAGGNAVAATQTIFENVIRTELRTEAMNRALFESIRSSAHDVTEQYNKIYGTTTVSYITFDPKSLPAPIQVTPADIEAEYKNNPTNPAYRTAEKRKVDYVLLQLTPEQLKLPEDQKKSAKDALGQKALDFALAFQPDPSAGGTPPAQPDFSAEAKKRGLNPMTTDFFVQDQTPANVPPSPAFNSAAFALAKESTISRVVDMANGVAVLHLVEIQPSDLRPLAEVKNDIQKQLLITKSTQSARIAAASAAKALQAAVEKGTDFKTAAANLKLKVETAPAFVPAKSSQSDPKLATLAYASISLKPNQVSGPIPLEGQDTTVIVHLDSRSPAETAGLAAFEKTFRQRQDEQLRSVAFADWANWKSKQPGYRKPADLAAYGAVE